MKLLGNNPVVLTVLQSGCLILPRILETLLTTALYNDVDVTRFFPTACLPPGGPPDLDDAWCRYQIVRDKYRASFTETRRLMAEVVTIISNYSPEEGRGRKVLRNFCRIFCKKNLGLFKQNHPPSLSNYATLLNIALTFLQVMDTTRGVWLLNWTAATPTYKKCVFISSSLTLPELNRVGGATGYLLHVLQSTDGGLYQNQELYQDSEVGNSDMSPLSTFLSLCSVVVFVYPFGLGLFLRQLRKAVAEMVDTQAALTAAQVG